MAQELKNFGVRVQRSVFECHLDREQTAALRGRLRRLIDEQADDIRYYRLCAKDVPHITVMGKAKPTQDWDYLVI